MAVSCTVFEIKRDIGRKRQFSIPLRIFPQIVIQFVRVRELLVGAKIPQKSSRLQQRYRRMTDGRLMP